MRDKTDFSDRLDELEEQILMYYLAKGYKLFEDQTDKDVEWTFEVEITSRHKEKTLVVRFWENGKDTIAFETNQVNTKDMFDEAFKHFKI